MQQIKPIIVHIPLVAVSPKRRVGFLPPLVFFLEGALKISLGTKPCMPQLLKKTDKSKIRRVENEVFCSNNSTSLLLFVARTHQQAE